MVAVIRPVGFDPNGRIIDSIEIDNRNIYDLENPKYRGLIFRTANNLHTVTRRGIIQRELLFSVGQPFSIEVANETARNLRTRFPLNDAWIEVRDLGDNKVLVRLVTIDQWSLIGGLRSFDRDGNETNLQFGFEERNFLGRAQFVSFDYYIQEKDDNYIATKFTEPRILGWPYSFQLEYCTDPVDKAEKVSFGRPFYSLAQRFSFMLELSNTSGRQERFFNGHQIAEWGYRGDRADLEVEYRWGPFRRKFGLRGEYRYLSQDMTDRTIFDPAFFSPEYFPDDSIYHRFDIGASYTLQDFIIMRRINGFDYNEDVTVGFTLETTLGRAFRPGFDSYHYDYLNGRVALVQNLGWWLLLAEYERSFWFKGSDDLRRLSTFAFTAYNNRISFLTVAFRTYFISDKSNDYNRLDLGGRSGLRGYDTESSSGDRAHVMNLEGRFFSKLELLSVKIGAAIFADVGRTWQSGEAVRFRDYDASFGAGLRLSLEKLTRAELVRIDLARTSSGKWDLSVSTGQYF